MSKSPSLMNARDSGIDVTEYEVIDKIEGDSNIKMNNIIHDDVDSNADDDGENPDDKNAVKDDDDSVNSNEPTWDYVETDIHKILSKDLWRTDATELDIADYIEKLIDLCSVERDNGDAECFPIKSQQDIFYRLGGYTILIGILNKYRNSFRLTWACVELAVMLSKDHPELVHHFVYAGIIDCIVAVMIQHPDLQELCLNAIQVCTTDEYYASKQLVLGKSISTTANDTIDGTDKSTGLNAIIQLMKKFPEREGIQEYGCQILYNISYEDLAERIIDAGAIGVLAVAMEQYSSNPSIKSIARKAMIELL
jgi:hypothetical protein